MESKPKNLQRTDDSPSTPAISHPNLSFQRPEHLSNCSPLPVTLQCCRDSVWSPGRALFHLTIYQTGEEKSGKLGCHLGHNGIHGQGRKTYIHTHAQKSTCVICKYINKTNSFDAFYRYTHTNTQVCTEFCTLHSYVEALLPNVTMFDVWT